MEDPLRAHGRDPGLRLIETLAWDGREPVREARHLARLARSAARLGWPCDLAAASAALRAGRDLAPARLRLAMDRSGEFEVTSGPLPAPAAEWTAALAPQRLASTDPWLAVKSTRRAVHDSARAALPAGVDEALLANEHDEICEGTITTVFFDRGEGWRTPPLASGCLPGILREELLERGVAREEPLRVEDLPVVRLALGNALRGLVPARLPLGGEPGGRVEVS